MYNDKQIKNMKINRITYLVVGVVWVFFGLFFAPFLFVGGFFILLSYLTNKAYKKALNVKVEPEPIKESEIEEQELTVKEAQTEAIEPAEPVSEERLSELNGMCKDIHKEYKSLLREYKDSDIDGKVYVLKECYRKLTVIESTIIKHACYDDINLYEEYERIEKKARSFINAYIKEERESGNDDYMIDVIQFSDDLDFISDYIYEKDEKLNKY